MYSIDINFLKDRPEYQAASPKANLAGQKTVGANYAKTPIFAGLGVGAIALLGAGGFWLFTNFQGKELQAKQKEMENKLGSLKAQESQLSTLDAEFSKIDTDAKALASALNYAQPWSAILQELRDNIPMGVQLDKVSQGKPDASSSSNSSSKPSQKSMGLTSSSTYSNRTNPNGSASPSPTSSDSGSSSGSGIVLELDGKAKTFSDVNNFLLTLKKSKFIDPTQTHIVTADLKESKMTTSVSNGTQTNQTELKSSHIEYKIKTALRLISSPELMPELERKGAVGLVTRLKSLQQKQVK